MTRGIKGMTQAQSRAWLALVSMGQILPSALDEQLTKDAGLINFEYGILSALRLAEEGKMRSGDLAAALGSPAPRISKAVSRLERRGLVQRVSCPDDGRAINVVLTEEGMRLWRKASVPHVEFARDIILGGLAEDQLVALADLLVPVLQNLDPDGSFLRTFATAAGDR